MSKGAGCIDIAHQLALSGGTGLIWVVDVDCMLMEQTRGSLLWLFVGSARARHWQSCRAGVSYQEGLSASTEQPNIYSQI